LGENQFSFLLDYSTHNKTKHLSQAFGLNKLNHEIFTAACGCSSLNDVAAAHCGGSKKET